MPYHMLTVLCTNRVLHFILPYSNLDHVVYHDQPLYTLEAKALTPNDVTIGNLIAEHLVEDGATLQVSYVHNQHTVTCRSSWLVHCCTRGCIL